MNRYAVVPHSGGFISNVVVGNDLATVEAVTGECVQETESTGPAVIGYAWDGSTFHAPEVTDVEA